MARYMTINENRTTDTGCTFISHFPIIKLSKFGCGYYNSFAHID